MAEKNKYYVAPRKSICIARGVAGPGEEICADDLPDPVPAKEAKAMEPAELKKLKEAQFKLLIDSEKSLLTRTPPDKPKAETVVDLRGDVEIQEVDLSTPPPEKQKKVISGAVKK